MPPKGRPFKVTPATKVSSKAAPAARVPYAPHPPPPREPFSLVGTPSLHLAPSSQPGYCLASSLFFLSEAWVPALRADVEALLCAFEAAWGGGGGGGGAGARAEGSSPCEVMRRLWESMGWKWLHLLGVPQDGAMRAPWGDSVVRAFVGQSSLPRCLAPVEGLALHPNAELTVRRPQSTSLPPSRRSARPPRSWRSTSLSQRNPRQCTASSSRSTLASPLSLTRWTSQRVADTWVLRPRARRHARVPHRPPRAALRCT